MKVEVVIPWQDNGCPHRLAAREWVLQRFAAVYPHWTVVVCEIPPDRPWVKAEAVTPAVQATSADVVVIHDADVWCEGTREAAQRCRPREYMPSTGWAVPHERVYRIGPDATRKVLDGEAPPSHFASSSYLAENPYRGVAGGGIVAIMTDVYLACPLDPRFVGWGGEDNAWGYALTQLFGPPTRGIYPLYHLWHPPQWRQDRKIGNPDSEALRIRYRDADLDGMAKLIGEAKRWPAISG